MRCERYRYVFPRQVPIEEVEATLLLALWGAECLHGEAQVRLDAAHAFDLDARACVIDAATPVGRDVNRLFVGFLRREFGPDSLRVERVASDLALAALRVTSRAKGVYVTLNPVKPDLQARRSNRVDWAGSGELAGDKDILRRRWLLIDADPLRDPHISATDAEKAAARRTIEAVRAFLAACGWPPPIRCDSGNGFHLLYRIDLPAEDGGLVERVLRALAQRFDSPQVKIDCQLMGAAVSSTSSTSAPSTPPTAIPTPASCRSHWEGCPPSASTTPARVGDGSTSSRRSAPRRPATSIRR